MSDALTPILSLTEPTVGSDIDSWGELINADLVLIDTAVGNLQTGKAALAGATFTGAIVTTSVQEAFKSDDVIASGTITLQLDASNVHEFTVAGALAIAKSGAPTSGKFYALLLRIVNGGLGLVWTGLGTIKTDTGSMPSLSTSGTDIVGLFTTDGGSTWTLMGYKLLVH